jgi:hypothetical protein
VGSPYQRLKEGKGNPLGGRKMGRGPSSAAGWIRSPGPFILFPIFFLFFFSDFFYESLQKAPNYCTILDYVK